MAGKPMDLPKGVEIFRNSLCIRFTWTCSAASSLKQTGRQRT